MSGSSTDEDDADGDLDLDYPISQVPYRYIISYFGQYAITVNYSIGQKKASATKICAVLWRFVEQLLLDKFNQFLF